MRRQSYLSFALAATLLCAGASCASGDANKASTTTASSAASAPPTTGSAGGSGDSAVLVHDLDPALAGSAVDVITTDNAGNPVVAWGVPKADGDPTTIISASTYDPAKHAYGDPVQIATVPTASKDYLAIATDRTSGTIAVAFEDQGGIDLATSTDDGKTWTSGGIAPYEDTTLGHPKLAIAAGTAYVLYSAADALEVASVPVTGAGSSDNVQVPGDNIRGGLSGGIAAAGSTIGVAYFVQADDGGTDVDYWTLGSSAGVKVTDSGGTQNDAPSVAVAFSGTNPVVAATLAKAVSGKNVDTVWTSTSTDGGKSFTEAVAMPLDASASPGFTTALVTAKGSNAAIAYSSNGGGGDDTCGSPKLIRTSNLTDWKICSIVPASPFTSFGDPSLAVTADGSTIQASFSNSEAGSNTYAIGIYSAAVPVP